LNRRSFLVVVLSVCLAVSLGFNVYQYINYIRRHGSSSTFTFTWGPEEQDIVPSVLTLEMAFVWDAEDLYVVAKVNDDDYFWGNYLGFAFDKNHNGVIDPSPPGLSSSGDAHYQAFADNMTYPAPFMSPDGCFGIFKCPTIPGIHTCTFNPSTGYTFVIPFRGLMLQLTNKLVHVTFHDYYNVQDGRDLV